MREIPFNQDLTEEQFKEYRTSFNIPSLGNSLVPMIGMLNVKKVKNTGGENGRL